TMDYVCPMHPEVVRAGPGACSLCGMALEPRVADEAPDPEAIDLQRRLWVSAPLAAATLLLAMSHDRAPWLQFALATPVVLAGARPFFARGWASIRARRLNMFTLIALGIGVAYAFSVLALVAPRALPAGFGTPPVYFEAAAVITTLVLAGQV